MLGSDSYSQALWHGGCGNCPSGGAQAKPSLLRDDTASGVGHKEEKAALRLPGTAAGFFAPATTTPRCCTSGAAAAG